MWYINPTIQLWGLSLRRCSLSTVLCYNNTNARCKLKQTSDLHESRLFFIRKTAPRQTVRQHRVTWIRPSCNSSFNDLLCGTVAIATSWHRSLLLSYLDKSVKLRRHCHRCCCCSRADLNWISEMRFLRRPTPVSDKWKPTSNVRARCKDYVIFSAKITISPIFAAKLKTITKLKWMNIFIIQKIPLSCKTDAVSVAATNRLTASLVFNCGPYPTSPSPNFPLLTAAIRVELNFLNSLYRSAHAAALLVAVASFSSLSSSWTFIRRPLEGLSSAAPYIIVIMLTIFMVLSSWHSHCESSPGSFDECRLSAAWPPTLRPNQPIWAVSPSRDWLLLLPSADTIAIYYYEPFRRYAPERLDVTARRRPTYSVKLRLWKISTFYFKIVAIPTPLTITITPLSAHY